MRINLAAALVASALIAGPALEAGPDSRTASLERDFVANGRISMDLSAGEYRLTGSSENKIKMSWDVRDAWRLSEVKARAEVQGTTARIVTDGPSNNFSVR